MRILFATSEVFPFSKTGGLADVAGALPPALARLGHEVLVVTPWYATNRYPAPTGHATSVDAADAAAADGGRAPQPPLWIGDVDAPYAAGFEPVGVGTLERDGVRYAFVGHDDFRRDRLYGYPDDVRRFARFTRAIPQVAARVGFAPDVVHGNDWHTGWLPMVLERGWHLPQGFPYLPAVFTVHNVQYQGTSALEETVRWLRLAPELTESWLSHFGRANALQAGLGFARRVTTVSPTYAQEIRQPEFGYGLDGAFRQIGGKLTGILNGLDTDVWNPRTDPDIAAPYDADDASEKAASKRALCLRFGLDPDRPLLGVVSRLAEQKGIDVFLDAAPGLVAQGWSLLVLGSGDEELEARLLRFLEGSPAVAAGVVGYDEALAHLIYAGADALAIPSRFEPCGLSQMIAMRYGTIPIARATGGLHDTIEHGRTGFLFADATVRDILRGASEAVQCYGTAAWSTMIDRAMRQDFSWNASAKRYGALYEELLTHTPGSKA